MKDFLNAWTYRLDDFRTAISTDTLIYVWLGGALIAALIAIYKHRSGLGFVLLSLILSPIVGIVAALLVMPNELSIERSRLAKSARKECTFCAEFIKPQANVCRYCGKAQVSVPDQMV